MADLFNVKVKVVKKVLEKSEGLFSYEVCDTKVKVPVALVFFSGKRFHTD